MWHEFLEKNNSLKIHLSTHLWCRVSSLLKKLWNTSIISKLFHWKLQEFIWSLDYFLYFWTIFLIYCLLFIKFLSHMNSVAKNFATNKIIMFTFSDNHKICMAAPSSKSSQYYWLGWFVGYKGKISPSRSVRHYLS